MQLDNRQTVNGSDGLVGFRFLNMKVLGVRIPFQRDFDEINLRVYVRRHERKVLPAQVRIPPRIAAAAISHDIQSSGGLFASAKII